MPRTGRRRQVERARWRQFRSVGENFAQEKTLVSYSGEVYRREDIRRMGRHLDRYRTWANGLLTA